MRFLKTVIISLAMALASGCSSIPNKFTITGSVEPRDYNPEQSPAYNIAVQTAQINGIYDVEIPEEFRDKLYADYKSDVAFANFAHTFFAAYNILNPMGVLSILMNANNTPAGETGLYPSLFGWRPNDGKTADQAASAVREQAVAATKEMLLSYGYQINELGINEKLTGLTDSRFGSYSYTLGENIGQMFLHIKTPEGKALSVKAPEYTSVPSDNAMLFSSSFHDSSTDKHRRAKTRKYDLNSSYLDLFVRNGVVNTFEMYLDLSQRLPDWMYLYIPANHAVIDEKQKVPMPFLLNQGKMLLFAKPFRD